MLNFNKVIFGGRVTADPIVKPVGSGSVANFTVAANYKRKKQDGTAIEEVCFLEVEAWGNKSDIAARFLHKGSEVMVEGRLKQSNWEDKTGNKRSKLSLNCDEIILMGGNGEKDTSVKDTIEKPKPMSGAKDTSVKTIAMIKGAGFEVTRAETRRIDDPDPKNKEVIDDLPF